MDTGMFLLTFLAEDSELIPYRKSLRNITGSVTSAILLQQIIHRAKQKGWQPFFKFRTPCKHKLYKSGDSWTEELGFSPKEFDTALAKIGLKITTGTKREDIPKNESAWVIYWTDSSRVTWYEVNRELLGNSLMGNYLITERGISKLPKGELPITESPTESPTENIGANSLDPVTSIFNLQGQDLSESTASYPKDQFWGYRDAYLELYTKFNNGRAPDQVAKEEIVTLAHAEDADPKRWERTLQTSHLNWTGNGPLPSLARLIDVYKNHQGDYKVFVLNNWPKENGKVQQQKLRTNEDGSVGW